MSSGPLGDSVARATFDRRLSTRQRQITTSYPQRLDAPVGSPGSAGSWGHPNMARFAQCVPTPGASFFLHRPRVAISFRNLREAGPSKGVHLSDLFRQPSGPESLDGADDIVFEGAKTELKFLIDWPGYAPKRTTISTISANGGPLTRRELGKNIMMAYARFFNKVVEERILPSGAGVYTIALHQDSEARPGSLGVQLWQLHLVNLREPAPGDDHWVAEVDIVPA